jgi:hypothetical protein
MNGLRSLFSMQRLGTMAVMALGLPGLLAAQRGGGMAGRAPAGHVGAPVMRAAAPPRITATAPSGMPRATGGGPSGAARIGVPSRPRNTVRPRRLNNFSPDFGAFEFDDVPGLGFDFPHLAAVSGGRHHRGFGSFVGGAPFFDGGFLFGAPSVIIEQTPPAQAAPEAVAEDAIAGDASEPARRPVRRYAVEASPEPVAQAPQAEQEQYVFVRRDGELLFAVAYSWENGMLRYITPDGMRRSVTREALDLQATEQFNEQRGVNFHAPA